MIAAAGSILLEGALRALIVALILWAGIRVLRVANARAQKAAWTMVLAAAFTIPLVMPWHWQPRWAAVNLPVVSWAKWLAFEPPAEKTPPAEPALSPEQPEELSFAPDAAGPMVQSAEPPSNLDEPPNSSSEAPPISSTSATPLKTEPVRRNLREQIFGTAWLIYLGVGLALLLRLFYGLASSMKLWLSARHIEIGPGIEVPVGIQVRWSRKISSPVNIGSGILLPADYAEWDREKIRVVLAHEAAHIRQRDFHLQLLAGLYAAVMWFSPLGWWLKHKLSELGEVISDHAGLEAATSPLAYAELLLEFAARPRLAVTGVAMAHSTNLHQRIERLLNESSFRRVFAYRRQSVAALVVPAVLIAASAVVHVEAAIPSQTVSAQSGNSQAEPLQPQPSAQEGQSHPNSDQPVDDGAGTTHPAAAPKPAPTPAPLMSPAPEATPTPAAQTGGVDRKRLIAPVAPAPLRLKINGAPPRLSLPMIIATAPLSHLSPFGAMQATQAPQATQQPQAEGASNDENLHRRDSYTVMGDEGAGNAHFHSHFLPGCMEAWSQANKPNNGHFLLVCHEGKAYIIDDPAIMAQVDAMDKALRNQGEQMKELGKQMRDAGAEVREEARKERETATNIPTPDLSKEMATLNASVADLAAKQGGTVTREQLAEIQREVSAVQRRVIDAEIRATVNIDMSKFDVQRDQIGAQMGKMGEEISRVAHENDQKIRSIIDESLKDGKAKPVN
jgi:beta-lactamase regulating signal transducer with metallopeptidase domain